MLNLHSTSLKHKEYFLLHWELCRKDCPSRENTGLILGLIMELIVTI